MKKPKRKRPLSGYVDPNDLLMFCINCGDLFAQPVDRERHNLYFCDA